MTYTITEESFDSLALYRNEYGDRLNWHLVFMLPEWLKVWWEELGTGAETYLRAVRQEDTIIGIAPLKVDGRMASFLGSVNVCDYLDFVAAPGREEDFFNVLLADLQQNGISHLDLRALRPDSVTLSWLVNIAQSRGYEVLCQPDDISLEVNLPPTWEEYLMILDKKQRHEVRRKLRRLSEAGQVNYRLARDSESIHGSLDVFFSMFTESRQDKADFLTAQMESFFKSMAGAMTEAGILRLGILELDGLPVAMIIFFDYNNGIYLYNSGYDPRYNSLSAGLLCKVLCIKESIEEGKKVFDFLKGDEAYKYHLGGKEVPLSRCQITISQ
ncbi:MAG: GNAT family N-acetyltransferase [Dehalococcoidales bacterium]|nr:MAG: GNAT family N-acetyltransferase [Dehalococcoidales bacterium]